MPDPKKPNIFQKYVTDPMRSNPNYNINPDRLLNVKDNRKINATSGKKINPNKDLMSGKYSERLIADITREAIKQGVDPHTAIAVSLQETNLGRRDNNVGHVLERYDTGDPVADMVSVLKSSQDKAKSLGLKNENDILQTYNGRGKIFPSTEQSYHGFKMKQAYGVDVPAGGIDMRKNPLYGKRVVDLRENVIKQNPTINTIVGNKGLSTDPFKTPSNTYADGGQIHNQLKPNLNNYLNNNMKQYAQGGKLTRFDEGGTHEQNPLGGIPQGQDDQGNMNTVEQGETKKNNFVYSNRISLDKDLIKQFNLPGYISNKSVADASKAIDEQFKDRQDKYAQETKKTLLERLSQAQEYLKEKEQAQQEQINQSMQANSQQVPDMMEGQIPEGMEEYAEQGMQQNPQEEMMEGQQQMYLGGSFGVAEAGNMTAGGKGIGANTPLSKVYAGQQYMLGGRINRYEVGGFVSDLQPAGLVYSAPGSSATPVADPNRLGAAADTSVKGSAKGFDASRFSTLGTGIGNSVYNQDQSKNANLGMINAAGASIGGDAGKYTQAATGIYDMGQEAFGKSNVDTLGKQSVHGASTGKSAGSGALKGASTGAALGSIVPGVGTVIGAGVGAIVGGVAGAIGGSKDEKAQALNNSRYAYKVNQQFQDSQNIAAFGGTLKPGVKYSVGNSTIRPSVEMKNNTVNMMAQGGGLTSKDRGSDKKPYPSVESGDFAGGGRSYPIPTKADAVDALRLAGLHGRSDVRAKVFAKYPSLKHGNGGELTKDMFDDDSNLYVNRYDVGGNMPIKPDYYGAYTKGISDNLSSQGTLGNNELTNSLARQFLDKKSNTNKNFNFSNNVPSTIGFTPTTKPFGDMNKNPFPENQLAEKFAKSNPLPEGVINPDPIFGDKYKTSSTDNTVTNKESWLDRNSGKFGEAMRYAPVAMNAYQLSQLRKPQGTQYNTLADKFKPQYVDEARLQNIVGQTQRNQINAISESGGSEGANRAAILGAGVNMNRGLSEAYANAAAENRATNERGQAFDASINAQNVGIKNRAIDEYRADQGNYDTQRSKYLGAIGTDIGSIGKEEVNKNQIAAMLGYDWRGNYMVDPKTGERITAERMAKDKAALEASNTKPVYDSTTGEKIKYSYGGFLKTNKRGY